MSLIVDGSRFVSIPIFLEWLYPQDFLSFDTALCNAALRLRFIRLVSLYGGQFQSLVFTNNSAVPLSLKVVQWCRRYSFSQCLGHLEVTKHCINQFQLVDSDDSFNCFQYLSGIVSLTVEKCDIAMTGTIGQLLSHCTRLKQITIRSTSGNVIDILFDMLMVHCPGITLCNIGACTAVNQKSLLKFVSHYQKTLTSLDVSFCKHVTNALVHLLVAHVNELKDLNIRGCCNISKSKALIFFLNGSKLTSFGYKYFTTASIRPFVWYHGSSLTKLDISNCNGVDDMGIIELSAACASLMDLNIAYCNQVTDVGIEAIALNLKQLVCIDLSWLTRITHKSLAVLLSADQRLETIHLWNNSNVNAAGLALINEKTSLKSLSIVNLKSMTEECLAKIVSHCTALTSLNISESKLEFSSLLRTVLCCNQLVELNLSLCSLNATVLLEICRLNVRLRVLHLMNTVIMKPSFLKENAFVASFSQYCFRLKHLNIKYCDALTGLNTVEAILKNCTRLRVLIASVLSLEDSMFLNDLIQGKVIDQEFLPRNVDLIVNYKR